MGSLVKAAEPSVGGTFHLHGQHAQSELQDSALLAADSSANSCRGARGLRCFTVQFASCLA